MYLVQNSNFNYPHPQEYGNYNLVEHLHLNVRFVVVVSQKYIKTIT